MTRLAKPQSQYRPILASALHHVFVKRDVWLFGIFALILGSGSAIETVLRAQNALEQFSDTPVVSRLFPIFEILRQWFDQLSTLPPLRAVITSAVLILVLLAVLVLSAISQGTIVHAAKPRKNLIRIRTITSHARTRLIPILGIGFLLKVSLGLCLLILLAPAISSTPFLSDLLIMIQWFVGYGLLFAASTLAVYALVGIVNHNDGFTESLRTAWSVFSRHPGASLEMALILFLLNLLVGLVLLLLLLLLSLPYTALFLAGAATGSVLATTMATTITFFVALAFLLVAGGITTAYNYTALTLFFEKLQKGRFKAKWQRIRTTGHWF